MQRGWCGFELECLCLVQVGFNLVESYEDLINPKDSMDFTLKN